MTAALVIFGLSLLLFAGTLGLALRRVRLMRALRSRGVKVRATLVGVTYASGGFRTRLATWRFQAIDPKTGQRREFHGTSPYTASDILDPTPGEAVEVRYLPDDPSVSALPSARALDGNIVVALGGFAVLTGIALRDLLEGWS